MGAPVVDGAAADVVVADVVGGVVEVLGGVTIDVDVVDDAVSVAASFSLPHATTAPSTMVIAATVTPRRRVTE